MAKKPNLKKTDKKEPRKPKTPAQEKQNFKEELLARIASYQEVAETDGFLARRNVRTALGIGNMKAWDKQFEDGYAGTSAEHPKKRVNPQFPYEKFQEERPLIKKVNTEKPRKLKPLPKEKK